MRRFLARLLVTGTILVAPPAALAQDADRVSQAAAELPPSLFEPAPELLPGRPAGDDAAGAPLLLAGVALAAAAAAGYLTGSARQRSKRSTSSSPPSATHT